MLFGVKRVLWHVLHISFPSSEDLMSTWHWEKAKFEAVFVLDLLLYYWLFINLPMSTESEFAFLKTAKVIFVWYTPEIFLKIIKIHHFPCWRLQWSKLRSVMTDQISNLTEQSFPDIRRNDRLLNETIWTLKYDKLHVFDMVDEMKRKKFVN